MWLCPKDRFFDYWMPALIKWARSYEEGNAIVTDAHYDGTVINLAWVEDNFPAKWEEVCCRYPEFKDGTYRYTGMFYKTNSKEKLDG